MRSTVSSRLLPFLAALSGVAAGWTALVGMAVLLGWGLDIPLLKSLQPTWVTMKANTALGFVLAGTSLWLLRPPPREPLLAGWRRPLGQLCAVSVAVLGLLTLSQEVFGWDFGIDQLLFTEPYGAIGTSHPGRMSPATALNFLLCGAAFLLLDKQTRRGTRPAQSFSLIVAFVSFLGLTGYVFGQQSFYRFGAYTSIAAHTAFTFMVLSAAPREIRSVSSCCARAGVSGSRSSNSRPLSR